jgi:hypothetical protein
LASAPTVAVSATSGATTRRVSSQAIAAIRPPITTSHTAETQNQVSAEPIIAAARASTSASAASRITRMFCIVGVAQATYCAGVTG